MNRDTVLTPKKNVWYANLDILNMWIKNNHLTHKNKEGTLGNIYHRFQHHLYIYIYIYIYIYTTKYNSLEIKDILILIIIENCTC